MNPPKSESPILWLQVSGLAGLQGAITLTWVIYGLYLPAFMQQMGLPAGSAVTLLVLENALAVLMEPLMGGLSDRAQRWVGTRLPFILAGVVLAATLFIAIPAIALFGLALGGRAIFLGVLITWSLAMTVVRSPMLCLLANYAFETKLPQAFSILTLVGGLASALRPLANQAILSAGPAVAFALGAAVLLLAAALLRSVHPPATMGSRNSPFPPKILGFLLLLLFLLGLAVAWSLRWLMGEILPPVFQAQVPGMNLNLLMGLFSIGLAVFALPAGGLATRIGNSRLMLLGLLGTITMVALLGNTQGATVVGVAIVLSLCLSPVLNGTIPLALSLVPPQQGGLAIGMYFGGFAAAMSLFGIAFGSSSSLPLVNKEMWLIGALLAAVGCITASQWGKSLTPQEGS